MVLNWKIRLREVLEHAKGMEPKERFRYLWGYFGGYAIALVALVAVMISIISSIANQVEPLLQVVMVDNRPISQADEEAFADFFEKYGYETYEDCLQVASFILDEENPNYAETHMALTATVLGKQDILMGDGNNFKSLMEAGAMADLRNFLSEELLEKYADSIVYSTADGTADSYPCAIRLDSCPWLQEYPYFEKGCWFGISNKTAHPEAAADFAEYILK